MPELSACRKSLFLKTNFSLTIPIPLPLSPGKGENTGTGVPATCLGATPKARMLWLLAKSFARCKTNRASNAKHPFLSTIEAYRQSESSGRMTGAFSYPDSSTLSVAGTAFYLSDTVAVIIRNIRINAVARAEFSRNNTV
jgi:hypothetical protein